MLFEIPVKGITEYDKAGLCYITDFLLSTAALVMSRMQKKG